MEIPNTKLKRKDLPNDGHSVRIDRAMRSSGLLASLAPQELQTLIALLTFIDESGRCKLSSRMLAQTLGLSESQAQIRLKRLCQVRWHHRPVVVRESDREKGRFLPGSYRLMEMDGVVMLSPDVASHVGNSSRADPNRDGPVTERGEGDVDTMPRQAGKVDAGGRTPTSEPPHTGAGHVTPVNTHITGSSCVGADYIDKEHTTENGDRFAGMDKRKKILNELLRHGVSGSIASELLDRYPGNRIGRQIELLPYRNAKEPAAMLIKAIKEDWAAPAAYMTRQREQAEKKAKAAMESTEAERRRTWQEQLEAAKSRLPSAELQKITGIARERTQSRLEGAFRGGVPERLVNIEVDRIIARKYITHDKT